MGFKSGLFPKAGHLLSPGNLQEYRFRRCPFATCSWWEGFKEKPIFFSEPGRGEELDSSDSQQNHGDKPGEKDDIDEKSFHAILIGLSAPKVKFFLVL